MELEDIVNEEMLTTEDVNNMLDHTDKVLSGKLNDALSGRLFCADFRTLQMCQSL